MVEGVVVICYALWRKKPVQSLLLTSILANMITQSMLRMALILFYRQYLLTLAVAEILVWMIESLFLYAIPSNRLTLAEAALLSLLMNLASLAVGWFLPL